MRPPAFWFALVSLALATGPVHAGRGVVIEDFESGSVLLESYPDQDMDPSSWEVSSSSPYGGAYALRIFGNTWKVESIAPATVDTGSVWRVAAEIDRVGEMQGFGVGDGVNELFYSFAGDQLPEGNEWYTVYQGAFPEDEWYGYLLPIGRDWLAAYGYLPVITRLIYVNDDDSGTPGVARFDEIADVTADLPVPPMATILYTIESQAKIANDLWRVGIQFTANVYDPDSPAHTFLWEFGDGASSDEVNPVHEFLVEADYTYTVSLLARDDDGLVGGDTCQVAVEPGSGDLPLTVDFVGDVFTGRSYESPGGIIDTYGVEALFEPTLGIFGGAADVNVCNLECSYTDRGTPHPTKSVVFRSRPENIRGIEYAGVDVVTLGNNHIVDYGEEGLVQTAHLLDSLGIEHSGAGANDYFALLPTFYTEKGVRMAFLGECNRTGRTWNYQPFLDAGYNKPGFGNLLPPNLASSIDAARGQADVVIVQLHSGDEYDTAPPDKAPFVAPPPVEAAEIDADAPDFRFRVEPSPGDRELRRLAADLGADVVINHHPHVLQGFESYRGKLIAHSLGNFIFDLYYPETMPTIVLTLEIDKEGIAGYTFVPAWIDDWIPKPATGALGRAIMDRLADYSRPMGALVAVFPDEDYARVHLDRYGVDSTVTPSVAVDTLVEEKGMWVSPPLRLAGEGNLSRVVTIEGGSSWEVRFGRDLLWHGGFEDNGATFWEVNSADEWLDSGFAHGGARCLALRRDSNSGGAVGTDLEKNLPCDPSKEHSITGWMRADNAADAYLSARFYSSRYSTSPVLSADAAPPFTGTEGWTRLWANADTPANGVYFDVRSSNDRPASGEGIARFDDEAFIEWEPWTTFGGAVAVPSPNDYRFVQVRSAVAAPAVSVAYEETAYRSVPTTVAGDDLPSPPARLRNFPNPFNPRTTIELDLAKPVTVAVSIDVFDVRGRKVASLYRGELPGGKTSAVTWDGRDDDGRPAPSGVYFARVKLDGETLSRKMVLLR